MLEVVALGVRKVRDPEGAPERDQVREAPEAQLHLHIRVPGISVPVGRTSNLAPRGEGRGGTGDGGGRPGPELGLDLAPHLGALPGVHHARVATVLLPGVVGQEGRRALRQPVGRGAHGRQHVLGERAEHEGRAVLVQHAGGPAFGLEREAPGPAEVAEAGRDDARGLALALAALAFRLCGFGFSLRRVLVL